MWPRLRIHDVRAIINTLGTLVLAVAFTMLIPLAIALLCDEQQPACYFLLSFGVVFAIGCAMRLVRPKSRGLTRTQALVITGLAWIVVSLVSAIPFMIAGYYVSPFDAFFDTVSCYTGTGMSVIEGLSKLPYSFNIWRFVMVMIGAQGIVIVALAMGTISKFSGAGMLFEAEGHQDRLMPGMATTARFIVLFMSAVIAFGTLVCTLICWFACGMAPLRALYHGFCLAVSSIATGGITPMDIGVVYYQQPILNAVLVCLMLIGAFSFAVYLRMAVKGPREFLRDVETRMILVWTVIVLTLMCVSFSQDPIFDDLSVFLDKGVFNAVSALTSTGFFTLSDAQLTIIASRGVLFCVILGMVMGGATSSTAGGIKAIRVVIVIKTLASEIKHALMPGSARDSIRYYHLGDMTLTSELSRNAMLVFLLFLLSYMVGAVMGVLYGVDPLPAVLESISCTNNCGISAGVVAADLPLVLKIVYLAQMLLGRLEFMTLLATLASIIGSSVRGLSESAPGRGVRALVPDTTKRAWQGKPYHKNRRN